MPPENAMSPAKRRRLNWIGAGLLAMSAFMFITIIIKTALRGP